MQHDHVVHEFFPLHLSHCTIISKFNFLFSLPQFFNDTTHRWEEEELNPSTPDVDLDEVQQSVNESLDTARDLTNRISELNKEMVDYMYQYANAKAGNKWVKLSYLIAHIIFAILLLLTSTLNSSYKHENCN